MTTETDTSISSVKKQNNLPMFSRITNGASIRISRFLPKRVSIWMPQATEPRLVCLTLPKVSYAFSLREEDSKHVLLMETEDGGVMEIASFDDKAGALLALNTLRQRLAGKGLFKKIFVVGIILALTVSFIPFKNIAKDLLSTKSRTEIRSPSAILGQSVPIYNPSADTPQKDNSLTTLPIRIGTVEQPVQLQNNQTDPKTAVDSTDFAEVLKQSK